MLVLIKETSITESTYLIEAITIEAAKEIAKSADQLTVLDKKEISNEFECEEISENRAIEIVESIYDCNDLEFFVNVNQNC